MKALARVRIFDTLTINKNAKCEEVWSGDHVEFQRRLDEPMPTTLDEALGWPAFVVAP